MRLSMCRTAFAVALAAFAAATAGCAGTTEDPDTGAMTSGVYPNLNIKPGVAAEQITPEERAAEAERIKETQVRAVASGGSPPANQQAQLTNLNRTHAKKTLDQIEKGDCSPRPTCD